jgi:hypothetical protein
MIMTKSWKTTLSGVIAIVIAAGNAIQGMLSGTPVDMATTIAAVMAGIGLISAKDNDVTGGTVKQ